MSNLRLVFIAARSVFLILLSCVLAINGKEWLANLTGLYISPFFYLCIVYIFVSIIIWVSTRDLLKTLRARKKESQIKTSFFENLSQDEMGGQGRSFCYSLSLRYLMLLMSAIWFSAPFVSEKNVGVNGYILLFSAGVITVTYAAFCFRYCVFVNESKIKIQGLIKRHEFFLKDIKEVNIEKIKGGSVAIVTLSNGRVLQFSGKLKNFPLLVFILTQQRSTEAGMVQVAD